MSEREPPFSPPVVDRSAEEGCGCGLVIAIAVLIALGALAIVVRSWIN